MKTINLLISVLLMTTVSSCNAQNRFDLENAIGKQAKEVVGDAPFEYIVREIVTHQPARKLWEGAYMNRYRFGDIKFAVGEEGFGDTNLITLILKSDEDNEVVGVFISVDKNERQAEEMKEYLTATYGEAETIQPEPTEMRDGVILGNSAYYWLDRQNDRSIYFYRHYYKENRQQATNYVVEVIANDAVSTDAAILEWMPGAMIIDWYKTRFR